MSKMEVVGTGKGPWRNPGFFMGRNKKVVKKW
jgi:hypothetical protein